MPTDAPVDNSFAALTARLETETGRPWWKISDAEYWFEQGKLIGAGAAADLEPRIIETKREIDALRARMATAKEQVTERQRLFLSSQALRVKVTPTRQDALRLIAVGSIGYDKSTRRFLSVKGAFTMPTTRTLWYLFEYGFIDMDYETTKTTWGAEEAYHPVFLTARGNASHVPR